MTSCQFRGDRECGAVSEWTEWVSLQKKWSRCCCCGCAHSKSPPLNHCATFYSSPPICVSACAATELDFLRLFLLLLSLVNTTHLPTQTGFLLVERIVYRSTSVRLAAFDWPPLLFFSSSSRRWVGAAVSPVWHVPSQILHGVKLDPPFFFTKPKIIPFSIPPAASTFLSQTHLQIYSRYLWRWRW